MFEQGNDLVWNASPSLATDDIQGATVTFKERTGANTATVEKDSVEFEVFLDELEDPSQF
jgi:sensor histidine kinase regulating citrate/malate metabolism